MDYIPFIVIGVLVLLIGFFSGMETAFFSASRMALELKKKQGKYSGKIWSSFLETPSRFMSSSITLITFLLVIYGIYWTTVFSSIWKYWHIENPYLHLAVTTFFATLLVIFVMFIMRAIFRRNNNSIIGSGFFTFIAVAFYSLFENISRFFMEIGDWMLKYIFNVKISGKREVFSKLDLEKYVQQLKMNVSEDSSQVNNEIFENVLSLSETKIRECLVPRKEIIAIDINTTVDEIINRFEQTKLSKLVVYENNIDNIKGYIHHLDMFKRPREISEVLMAIPLVPDSMNATDLIKKFSKEKKSVAWVVDEFGGTAGIITIEDLLEEIFGSINDEFDVKDVLVDKQINTNEFIFSGRIELDFLKEKYQLAFRKAGDVETLSGYIINLHQSIPQQKDRIIIDDYQFDILNVSDTRIEVVKLKVLR
ncbi:MAG: HlyC/CorC family transporter [Bacteroidetes bacterium]|nr:HlyC/CorC family transporter [Bacteroidota bacterium]